MKRLKTTRNDKARLAKLYRQYTNSFSTVSDFAKSIGCTEDQANLIISNGKKYHDAKPPAEREKN